MDKARILIVEDEVITAIYLKQTLESLGYIVTAVPPSGVEALHELVHDFPDLIIMDIRLQGEMTGVDLMKKIRKTSDVPVIYLTADLNEATLMEAEKTKPSGYIIKPFENKELLMNIELALFRHRNKKVDG